MTESTVQNTEEFSFPTDPDEICDTLYGTQTYFSRCVGYCNFHKVYVTSHQLKEKKCLSKNCDALIKQPSNEYWQAQEYIKQQKFLKKQEKKRLEEIAESKIHAESKTPGVNKSANAVQKKKRYICLDLEMCELTPKERKNVKGMSGEVIQIGAVMLDENLFCISEFSTLVKPVYGKISNEIERLTGISNESVKSADSFSTAFYKFVSWAGNDELTVFCWSDSDYKQLWDEVYIKAKNHDEYREFLRRFVDLQAVFGKFLGAQKPVSLDVALKFCHLKFKGQRHTAFSDAYNTARILYKLTFKSKKPLEYDFIASYTQTEISKKYFNFNSFDKDYTSSLASFLSPELLEKFGYSEEQNRPTADVDSSATFLSDSSEKKIPTNFITKKLLCTRYGISVGTWIRFSFKMMFAGDLFSKTRPAAGSAV